MFFVLLWIGLGISDPLAMAQVLPAELLADGRAVGAVLRVQTRAGERFEGVVFTLDPVADFLFLGASQSVKKRQKASKSVEKRREAGLTRRLPRGQRSTRTARAGRASCSWARWRRLKW